MEYTDFDLLLIEDNPHEAELAIRNLKKHGVSANILHIDNGEAAINYFYSLKDGKSKLPRLILLDLKLPRISGHEILEKIRSNKVTRHIPVVILTSSGQESDIVRSYELGANSYIVKPVNFDIFSRVVADLGTYWMAWNRLPYNGTSNVVP